MPPPRSNLEDLRRRLDQIDNRLHDLLIERAEVVLRVRESKKLNRNLSPFQPAREAEIIRRLARRHHGPFPVATIVRMWREMIAATLRMQTDFAVAVFAPPDSPGFWDLARDHYGSHTPMSGYGSIGQVIRAVGDGSAAVGVLPMPQEGEADPWWRHLLSNDQNAPRVVARLPFGARGNARNNATDALVIGRFAEQPTGEDRTLFATETAADISRGRIFAILASLGLSCTFFASFEHAEGAVDLIEVEGFVPISDPRLERLRAELGEALHRLLPFGGYAVPLSPALFSALPESGQKSPVLSAVKG
jgi:chorismate mutase / prephenate dehydratase